MSENIILIGYRGSGKSAVSQQLSENLSREVISIDAEIEKKIGSIPEYVDKNGWESFRKIEGETLNSLNVDNRIVDCGGGIIETAENISFLVKMGAVFWLKAGMSQIEERISHSKNRPSLTGSMTFIDEIETVYERRMPLYRKAADFEIDTNNKTVNEICIEIVDLLKFI